MLKSAHVVVLAVALAGCSPAPVEDEGVSLRPAPQQARAAPPTATPFTPATPQAVPTSKSSAANAKTNPDPDHSSDGSQPPSSPSRTTPDSPRAVTKKDAAPETLVAPFDANAAKQKQIEWARFLGSQVQEKNSVGMKLMLIPAGTFSMGLSAQELEKLLAVEKKLAGFYLPACDELQPQIPGTAQQYANAQPTHTVTLTRPFYLAETETTRANFADFVNEANYAPVIEGKRKYGTGWYTPKFLQTPEHPIVRVTWNDAMAFCEWLSKKENQKYRLPTEAEWEFACRAGTTTLWSCGDDYTALQDTGHVSDAIRATIASRYHPRSQNDSPAGFVLLDGYLHTAPSREFHANPFGLHDMHGNVWEWCADGYDPRYYATSSPTDPAGATSASNRSLRGGSWYTPVRSTVSAYRLEMPPASVTADIGFRVVREINPKPSP